MGRGKKKPDHRRPGGPKWKQDDRDKESEFVVEKRNPRFESYYKEQGIVSESEWEDLLSAFRASLPVTFRLAGSRATAQDLNDLIKTTYIPHLSDVIFEGNAVPPPIQLPWYPDGLAWQLNVQKSVVRKSPEFKKFQDFLVYENDVGNISRQEAVSMIPPLLLDVEPQHKVLDMCAAPGSKTAQLLDALHSGPSGADPTGVVIANDSDYKRAYMLVHQSARFHSTAMMVTNLDASLFPNLKIGSDKQRRTLFFDRILCDVPCSGDGTLRKNLQIWKSWQPAIGNGLHPLQLRILLRAMQMLAPNGRLVYSTCSLNPVENEAVLAAALNSMPGQYHLVDVSSRLLGLKRRPGLNKWRVAIDKDATVFFDSQPDFLASLSTEREKKERGAKVPQTLFSPENAHDLHLERSMRIYPHLQDTGAFFIAVLERVQETSVAPSHPAIAQLSDSLLKRTASNLSDVQDPGPKKHKGTSTTASEENIDYVIEESSVPALISEVAEAGAEEAKVTTPPKTWKESPYTFFPPDHRHLKSCLAKLHIKPEAFADRLYIRTADLNHPRAIYVCNLLVRDIIEANDPARIRLINCGVKAFTRQSKEGGRETDPGAAAVNAPGDRSTDMIDDGAPSAVDEKDLVFRFVYEGVEAVLSYVDPAYILVAGLKELRRMLEVYYPQLSDFNDSFEEQIGRTTGGAHLVRFEAGGYDGAILPKPITLPIWISAKSLTLMSDKQTKSALCLRVFGEDFTPFGKELRTKKRVANPPKEIDLPATHDSVTPTGNATINEQQDSIMDALELEPKVNVEGDASL